MEFKQAIPYDVRICGSSNGGFILHCGCCTMTYSNEEQDQMIYDLQEYCKDPKGVEERYQAYQKELHQHPRNVEAVPQPDYGTGPDCQVDSR